MESQALQELVGKIFSDEETKSQFAANPEGVLSKFALTECERRAVLSAETKFGLINSDSLHLSVAGPLDDYWF
jgi:hypothetical protein